MTEFRIVLTAEAQKNLRRIPKKFHAKIFALLELLRKNPFEGKKLHEDWQGHRVLRAWPYRIIYWVDGASITVTVVTIGHRQGVYK